MQIHDIGRPVGARKRKKIVGRGKGSGSGKTAGRGQGRNQRARSGRGIMFRLEGGQMPLMKRLPKVGFRSRHPIIYQIVDIGELSRLKAGTVVDAVALKDKGLIKNIFKPYKILGDGEIKNPLTIKAYAFSQTAFQKIQAAGGKTEVITAKSVKDALQAVEK